MINLPESTPPEVRLPVVPETIVVHLGAPNQPAENVEIPFSDYIKNVASSEIYPTWPEEALRANIYAQISFALNRIYTEWYRSRGYDFDITSSTQFDQAFVKDRDVFENVSDIVDEIFNDYLRRPDQANPLFAQFCSGTTVTCDGLSQWGSVDLANQGLDARRSCVPITATIWNWWRTPPSKISPNPIPECRWNWGTATTMCMSSSSR